MSEADKTLKDIIKALENFSFDEIIEEETCYDCKYRQGIIERLEEELRNCLKRECCCDGCPERFGTNS